MLCFPLYSHIKGESHASVYGSEMKFTPGGFSLYCFCFKIIVGDEFYLSPGDTILGHGFLIENRKLKTKKPRRFVKKEDGEIGLELMNSHTFVLSGESH